MGEVKAVADMHQRKAEMARRSDAFIALPGSFTHKSYLLFKEKRRTHSSFFLLSSITVNNLSVCCSMSLVPPHFSPTKP